MAKTTKIEGSIKNPYKPLTKAQIEKARKKAGAKNGTRK